MGTQQVLTALVWAWSAAEGHPSQGVETACLGLEVSLGPLVLEFGLRLEHQLQGQTAAKVEAEVEVGLVLWSLQVDLQVTVDLGIGHSG